MSINSSAPPSNTGSPSRSEDAENIDAESIAQLATSTIVIHPGSSLLRIGRASDPQPAQIPHVIAWHRDPARDPQPARDKYLLERDIQDYASNRLTQQKQGLDEAYQDILQMSGRKMSKWKDISRSNKHKTPDVFDEGCGWWWTDTSQGQKFLIGDDALYIDENDCYDLHWPIVKGQLNVKPGVHGSLSTVINDIENLWTKAIETFLKIPKKEFSDYRCVLLIPDIYNRQHVKELVHMLINQMEFSAILVHQESVCAAYGCGVSTACIVDVGHHKTSICCIEDGFSHAQTRICLDVGGRDIASVFAWLLQRNSFPYRTCDPNDRMDALLLDELKTIPWHCKEVKTSSQHFITCIGGGDKAVRNIICLNGIDRAYPHDNFSVDSSRETFCHMDLGSEYPQEHEFHLRRPGQKSLLYPITLGDETMQAPLALFYPKIFGLEMDRSHVHYMKESDGDPEDPFDQQFLLATRNRQEEAKNAFKREKSDQDLSSSFNNATDFGNDNEDDDDDAVAMVTSQSSNSLDNITNKNVATGLISLDSAIAWSVENCPESYEDELKRRMYACVLVTGGGIAHFKGSDGFLTRKLQMAIPASPYQEQMIEHVNVCTKMKDQDPSLVAWKGGSVLPCLDNAQELWISRTEWQLYGLKLLRERSPFAW